MKDLPDEEDFRAELIQAEAGDVKAQIKVAQWYLDGVTVATNPERAAYWFKQAAEAGNGHAQYMLAFRYHLGDGVPQNPVY